MQTRRCTCREGLRTLGHIAEGLASSFASGIFVVEAKTAASIKHLEKRYNGSLPDWRS